VLKTVSLRQLQRSIDEAARDPECAYPRGVTRPLTRADCSGGARPCPFVSCKFHLKLDVTTWGGVMDNFPGVEVWDMPETCALDVAERGSHSLAVVGRLVSLTKERIRQIERKAIARCHDVVEGAEKARGAVVHAME
jgi:hypothetical protein